MRSALQFLTLATAVGSAVAAQPANEAAGQPVSARVAIAPSTAKAPMSATIGGHVIKQAADGLFYTDAKVNGTTIHFVVDTGSSVVVLCAEDASRAGVGSKDAVAVDTAGGSAAMNRARIGQVTIADRTVQDVDAAIVHGDLKVSLLGQSVLSHLNSVTLKGDELVLD